MFDEYYDEYSDFDEVRAAYVLGHEQGRRASQFDTIMDLCHSGYLAIDRAAEYLEITANEMRDFLHIIYESFDEENA